MRGMPSLLYETSKLDKAHGITYRGKDLYDIKDNAPRAPGGTEPLPESILWLLMTGELPNV
jgi:citrate synthase